MKERPLNKRIIFVLTLAFLPLLTIPRAETAMVEMSLEELVKEADLIVVGTVEDVSSELWQGKVFSYATISVKVKVKGELEQVQEKIVVRFAGGTVGDIGMRVGNGPDYKVDENIVVFLKKLPREFPFKTVASMQGKFLIEDNIVVRENLELDQFLDRIENIMRSGP